MEAYVALSLNEIALPFGIYDDETPIGFAMFSYNFEAEEGAPKISKGNYVLWRFMIDKNFQNKSFGKKALSLCLDYLRTYPCAKAEYYWLSYEPENTVAKKLYESFGFRENGEMCENELVSVIKL